jgi:hypothetical protein
MKQAQEPEWAEIEWWIDCLHRHGYGEAATSPPGMGGADARNLVACRRATLPATIPTVGPNRVVIAKPVRFRALPIDQSDQ